MIIDHETPDVRPDDDAVFIPVVIQALGDDAPAWAETLNTNLAMLATGVNQTNASISLALDAINFVKNEVGPIVDSLSKNPMFKMLGVGK